MLRYKIQIINLSGRDAQVYGTIAGKLLRKKVIWTDHGDLKWVIEYTGHWQRRLLYWATSLVDHVICVSNTEQTSALQNFPSLSGKTSVIYNGIRGTFFNKPRMASERPVLFSTARIQPEKGFVDLIEAMELVVQKVKDVKLIVAGGVDDQALLDLAQTKLGDHFEYLGYLKPKDVSVRLSQCWVFVFPSHTEAFSQSILEAMHAAAPIVATTVGGIPEQIENEISGLLVPPRKPKQLAEAIIRLLRNRDLRATLAKRAQDKATKEYDLEHMVGDKIIKLYNSLV